MQLERPMIGVVMTGDEPTGRRWVCLGLEYQAFALKSVKGGRYGGRGQSAYLGQLRLRREIVVAILIGQIGIYD